MIDAENTERSESSPAWIVNYLPLILWQRRYYVLACFLALLAAGTVTTLLSIAVFRASDRRAKDRGLLDQTTGS